MTVTPTELRADLYRLLDVVIDTGRPLIIRRGEHLLRIELGPSRPVADVFEHLPERPEFVAGDIDVDWLREWSAGRDL